LNQHDGNGNRSTQEDTLEVSSESEEEKKASSLGMGLEKDEIILLAGREQQQQQDNQNQNQTLSQSPLSSPSSPSLIQERAARKARSWRPPTPPPASSYDTITNNNTAAATINTNRSSSSSSSSPVFATTSESELGSAGTSINNGCIPSQRFFPFNLFSSNSNTTNTNTNTLLMDGQEANISMLADESLLLANNQNMNQNHDDPITITNTITNNQSQKRSFKRRNKFIHALLPTSTSPSPSSPRRHRNRNRNDDEFNANDTYQMMKSHHGTGTIIHQPQQQPTLQPQPPIHTNLPLEQSSFFYNDMDNDMNMQSLQQQQTRQQQSSNNTYEYSYFQPNTRRTFTEQHALLNASFPALTSAIDPEDSHDSVNVNENGNDNGNNQDQDFDFSTLFAFGSSPTARDRDRDRHERRKNRPIMADIRKSSLSYMREGRMQMRVPGDNVRLVMDDYLEAGILSVELDWGGAGGNGSGSGSGEKKKKEKETEVSYGEGVARSLSLELVESIDLDDGENECPNSRAFRDEDERNSKFKDMDSRQAQVGEGSISSVLLEPQRVGMGMHREEEEEDCERGGLVLPLSGRKKAASRKGYSPLDHGRNGGDYVEGTLEHAGPGHAHANLEYTCGNVPAHAHAHAHVHTNAHRNRNSKITSGGPTRLPELRYMMTVDQDLYKRVLKEIPDSRMPCGFYYCCHDSVDGTKSVKISVAIMILFVVFTLLFVGTCIWPTG